MCSYLDSSLCWHHAALDLILEVRFAVFAELLFLQRQLKHIKCQVENQPGDISGFKQALHLKEPLGKDLHLGWLFDFHGKEVISCVLDGLCYGTAGHLKGAFCLW